MGFDVVQITDRQVYGSTKVYFEILFSFGSVIAQPNDLSAQRSTSESVEVCNSHT
jgi:hypothetical protein